MRQRSLGNCNQATEVEGKSRPVPGRFGAPSLKRLSLCLVAILTLLCGARTVSAQATLENGTIFGSISDASGAAIPGAMVEVTGASLQGSKTATTDEAGSYRISDLPAGTYHVSYSKMGFQTDVRNDFSLIAGFAARVDVVLQVGATSQTVEVTGQAPVIDTSTTVTSTDLERPVLDSVPTTRSIFQAVYMAPGIRPSATPDVGGNQLGQQQAVGSYGFNGNMISLVDGINALQSNSINGSDAPGDFVDFDAQEELRVISTGADADIGPAGTVMMTIMKSGGNQWHGDVHAFGEPRGFQLTNLPSTVPGGSTANQLEYDWDVFGDLGGHIIKDKLWIYGAWHIQRRSEEVVGYVGPNGGQGLDPIRDDNIEGKLTYQATSTVKALASFARGSKIEPQRGGSATIPYGSTYDYNQNYFWTAKGEVVWTPNAAWLVDILGGDYWQPFGYPNQAGTNVVGNPWTVNQTTGITSGPMINLSSSDIGSHNRLQTSDSVSHFTGKHSIQFGTNDYLPQKDTKHLNNHPAGDYELLTTGTTTIKPFELETFNFPLTAEGKERAIGIYGKDVWRLTKNITLNYGARYDRYKLYHDAEQEPAGPFTLAVRYPYQTDVLWNRVTPRVGVAYDLRGNGKTVIRASYGVYNIDLLGQSDITYYNPGALFTNTYNWAGDTCQVTTFTKCAPSAPFLSAIQASIAAPSATTFNGQNIYITTTGGIAGVINPNLRMPFFNTFSATVERSLGSSMALRVNYVGNYEEDEFDLTFPNRPISAYNQAFNTVYPATDPVNAGKPITIYYYPNSLKTANATALVNRNGNGDNFNTLEFTFTKRQTRKWSALGTLDLTKNHQYLTTTTPAVFASGESSAQPAAPFQTAFPLNSTWDWAFKSYFTYDLPYRIQFGVNYQLLAGQPYYAEDQFSVPNLGTTYIPVNKYGTYRTPQLNVLNLKFGRVFPIKEHDSLEFTVELFNALNAAPGTTVNSINGAIGTPKQFGFTSVYMDPMVGRIGAQFKF